MTNLDYIRENGGRRMNCENCGAPLHGNVCEYCGSEVIIDITACQSVLNEMFFKEI